MLLNTNTRPTYRDVIMVARLFSKMAENPAYIFETTPGYFAVYAAENLAGATAQGLEDGHARLLLVEVVRAARQPAMSTVIDVP